MRRSSVIAVALVAAILIAPAAFAVQTRVAEVRISGEAGPSSQPHTSTTRPLSMSPLVRGKPVAANTGPPDGITLRTIDGDVVLKEPGEVLDSVRVNGSVRVTAPGVTIRNSYIAGRAGLSWGQPLIYAGSGTSAGLRIVRTEVAPADASWIVSGIYGFGFTAVAVDVHHVIDQVHIFGDDVTVSESWLHDNYHGPDPEQANEETHDDNVQVQRGSNIVLKGNSLSGAHNAALQVTQGTGVVSNLVVSDNWVAGGGCSLNIADGTLGAIRDLSVVGNRFGASGFDCPILLTPATKASARIAGNVWEGQERTVHLTCRADGQPNWRC